VSATAEVLESVRPAPAVVAVCSPATGERIVEVPDLDAAAVAETVARARAAVPAWAASLEERVEALLKWRDLVLDTPLVPETLVKESGKPRHEAEGIEVLYLCELIRAMTRLARRALAEETRNPLLFLTKKTRLVRHPLGVVGVIGPWNFPILNNAADAVAPLLAGNAVVLKPSEVTPLTSCLLRDLWVKAGNPKDAFQVVTGRGATGAALVDLADAVMFTGSVATGRRIAARCGERLVPCVTELGGKSPFVVLAGADLERAAQAAAWSSFIHSGQVCIRTERIYVHASVADRFETLLASRVGALRQAAPEPGGGAHDLGSVTFARQIGVVERQIADAVAKGARVLTGGARRGNGPGLFFEPTVLSGATHDMEVMREETFGPLVPVMRFWENDEALRLANDTHLGLNATVFGKPAEAEAFARRLQSGQAIVNDVLVNYFVVESPLGGWRASGLGVRHGVEGLRQWTRAEAVTMRRPLLAPVDRFLAKKLAFPYDPRVLAVLRRAMRLLYRRSLVAKLRPPP
jgi:acyl-CoA reductase-like NAD-dependent aldehyde dehydrogenase